MGIKITGKNLLSHLAVAGQTMPHGAFTKRPDVIFTFGKGTATCCIAVSAGFNYGINSSYYRSACLRSVEKKHEIVFVDNPFKKYDYTKHLRIVADVKPKYATVRDMMTKEQCADAGIDYFDPLLILEQAEQLRQFANNVIVIPKSEKYVSLIPHWFVIGLPVPSSYGSDALPLECYQGRRVHLLGGSWARQLSYLYTIGNGVVSLDTNYIQLIAKKGGYVDPVGQVHQIKDIIPFDVRNVMNIAFSISCGSIQLALDRLTK